MIFHNIIPFVLIINLLLTGCTSKMTGSYSSLHENGTVTVKYNENASWEFRGNGTIRLTGYTYSENELHELFQAEYRITDLLTVSLILDKDKNLSVYNSMDSSTQLYNTYLETKEDQDTGYVYDRTGTLEKGKTISLFLKCRNMSSIQSDFEDDYKTLKAEWAVVVVVESI